MLNWLRNKRLEQIDRELCEYVREEFSRIDGVKVGQGMFNLRCHENAVQWAYHTKGGKVVQVMCIDEGEVYLHYINQTRGGVYIDNTLGWRADYIEYHLIGEVDRDRWHCIVSDFEGDVDGWWKGWTNWFDRHILKIERVV